MSIGKYLIVNDTFNFTYRFTLGGEYTSGYFGDIKARVINGYDASPVPHMVALTVGEHSKILLCGASLITKRHVLTAAHCIDASIDKGKLSR